MPFNLQTLHLKYGKILTFKQSYNFKLGFALSNGPHFKSVYLVRVPFLTGIAVYLCLAKCECPVIRDPVMGCPVFYGFGPIGQGGFTPF